MAAVRMSKYQVVAIAAVMVVVVLTLVPTVVANVNCQGMNGGMYQCTCTPPSKSVSVMVKVNVMVNFKYQVMMYPCGGSPSGATACPGCGGMKQGQASPGKPETIAMPRGGGGKCYVVKMSGCPGGCANKLKKAGGGRG